ncbi:MAG: amidohydrolase [Gammaproteobacteria bacterium]|nr:amidohydrolase [Gammaproteobacteria bacterium]MDH3480066.1 amidohydrolase [Gammaproteobacteria bacterium]
MNNRVAAALAGLALLSACGERTAEKEAADFVFTNAAVYTANEEQPWAEAVAIKGDEIVYVGNAAGAEALVGASTIRSDVRGQLLLPGFIDSHVHPVAGGAYATALSLDTSGSVEDWVAAIADYAAENKDAPVLFGYGFLATTFGPVGPTRQLIDDIVPNRPVLIMDEGFHAAWANTAALEALNITQDTPDPVPGFSYYKRDADGDATGYLLEGTAGMAMDGLDVITEEIVVEGLGIVLDIMNAYGVTAAFDAGVIGYEHIAASVLKRTEENDDLTVRLVGSYRPRGPEDAGDAVDNVLQWGRMIRGERYRYNVLKIMDDGTVEGRTAAMFEDYQGEPGNSGETVFTQEEMTSMVVGAAGNNVDVHIHALGERAIHEALNAIEAARQTAPESSTRYAICHIQVITDEDLPRFSELDVIAQGTPLWASYDTYGKQFVSDDQFRRFWRFKSLKDLGVRLSFGSDFPASGAGTLGLSPVVQIEIGHTRQNPGEPEAPIQPRETERLDVESLVRGFTINAAYQMHMEDEIGSIEVGKKADLVILDENIFEIDAYDIHKAEVVLTMMDGDIVYKPAAE